MTLIMTAETIEDQTVFETITNIAGNVQDVVDTEIVQPETVTATDEAIAATTTSDAPKEVEPLLEALTSSPHVVPKPNIVFILADNVGWNDLSYNSNHLSPILTPEIDRLAKQGIIFTNYYTQSLSTPSRAALLTGRYAAFTGLNNDLHIGSVSGLSAQVPTLPQILRNFGDYRSEMVGKWQLGHAYASQTPTGRGFQRFTGLYTGYEHTVIDAYSKQLQELPWDAPVALDWVTETVQDKKHETKNNTDNNYKHTSYYESDAYFEMSRQQKVHYHHYAEPLQLTHAIAAAAEAAMEQHHYANNYNNHNDNNNDNIKNNNTQQQPLFLYVSFASFVSSSPANRHTKVSRCESVPNLWRKSHCQEMSLLDEAVGRVRRSALHYLGENTLLVFVSDQGGDVFSGGNNQPYRGQKGEVLEGGIKVPAFVVDLSSDQKYLRNASTNTTYDANDDAKSSAKSSAKSGAKSGAENRKSNVVNVNNTNSQQRYFSGLAHVSDWLPTLLQLAQVEPTHWPTDMDGYSLLNVLQETTAVSAETTVVSSDNGRNNDYHRKNNGNDGNHININTNSIDRSVQMGPREEILLELVEAEHTANNEPLFAFRYRDYKYIEGTIKDGALYFESIAYTDSSIDKDNNRRDTLDCSDVSWQRSLAERVSRFADFVLDPGSSLWLRKTLFQLAISFAPSIDKNIIDIHNDKDGHKGGASVTRRLYDLSHDPSESTNILSPQHWSRLSVTQQSEVTRVSRHIETRLRHYRDTLQSSAIMTQNTQYILPLEHWRRHTRVSGDCPSVMKKQQCVFVHPWLSHSSDADHDNGTAVIAVDHGDDNDSDNNNASHSNHNIHNALHTASESGNMKVSARDWDKDLLTVPHLMTITDHNVLRARDSLLRVSVTLLWLSLLITALRLCFGPIPKAKGSDAPGSDKKKKKKEHEADKADKPDKQGSKVPDRENKEKDNKDNNKDKEATATSNANNTTMSSSNSISLNTNTDTITETGISAQITVDTSK